MFKMSGHFWWVQHVPSVTLCELLLNVYQLLMIKFTGGPLFFSNES